MTDSETKVRPSLNKAIYRDKDDEKWYWKRDWFSHPVGPFKSREDARNDFRKVMGIRKED